jgi:hypothetical protein
VWLGAAAAAAPWLIPDASKAVGCVSLGLVLYVIVRQPMKHLRRMACDSVEACDRGHVLPAQQH